MYGINWLKWKRYCHVIFEEKSYCNHRFNEIERVMYELSQGYWVVDRMFPKFAKCDFYQHSMIGQIDVSSHLQ